MSRRNWKFRLEDIDNSLYLISEYVKNMDYASWREDRKTMDAVIRNIEIIGEAVKNLSPDFKRDHRNLDWKSIAGFRDRVIHHYFGVNWDIVWDVVRHKVPELKAQLPQ